MSKIICTIVFTQVWLFEISLWQFVSQVCSAPYNFRDITVVYLYTAKLQYLFLCEIPLQGYVGAICAGREEIENKVKRSNCRQFDIMWLPGKNWYIDGEKKCSEMRAWIQEGERNIEGKKRLFSSICWVTLFALLNA